MARLDTITVRLRNPEVDRYARVTFDLELGSAADNAAFENNKPKLRDVAVSIMSDHSYEDLAGSAGIAKLKEEMLEKATPMFAKGRLHAVYISEFLLQ